MKSLLIGLLVFSTGLFAQDAIPAGTVFSGLHVRTCSCIGR